MAGSLKNFTKLFVILLVVAGLFFGSRKTKAEIVEELADRTEGANGIQGAEYPDPPDARIADVFPPFELDAGQVITGIDWRVEDIQDLSDAFTGIDKKVIQPKVEVSLAGSAPNPGDTFTLVARPQNFEQIYTEQYFLWCLGTRERRIAQNGVLAGGERIPMSGNGVDCYDDIVRRPDQVGDFDSNGDGLGDRWSKRNFGTLDVDIEGDPDRDGFELSTQNGVNGPNGAIRLAPNSIAGGTLFDSCDGKFTNGEEYAWGTNPIDPDTDDDGYSDEEDVCGKGGISFSYTTPSDAQEGDAEFLELIAVGYSNFREGDGEIRVAKIANSGTQLYFGEGEALQGFLEHRVVNELSQDSETQENKKETQKEIYVNDEVEFRATIENTKAKEANLHYQWSFTLYDGGVDTPDAPNRVIDEVGPLPNKYGIPDDQLGQAGYNLNPYRLKIARQDPSATGTGFNVTPKTGNRVKVLVTAIEPETGKKVDITEEFTISLSVTLDFEPGLPIQPVYPGADISSAPTYLVTATTPGIDPNDFLFEWFIDEVRQPNSKIGGSTLSFKATKRSGGYKIAVIITRVVDEAIFAKVKVNALVAPLEVELTNCPQLESDQNIAVGQTITINALINAQGEFPGELEYRWTMNGKDFTAPTSTPQNSLTFIPENIGGYVATYLVQSVTPETATADPYVPLLISESCRISVNMGGTSVQASASKMLASVVGAIPGVFRGALIFGAITFIVLIALYIVRSGVRKHT